MAVFRMIGQRVYMNIVLRRSGETEFGEKTSRDKVDEAPHERCLLGFFLSQTGPGL